MVITKELNEKLNSKPVLYGSLGLSITLEKELDTDDIDILVEHSVFERSLQTVQELMISLGYELANPEKNEFHKDQLKVGIATDGDMLKFSGVDPTKLELASGDAIFRVLSAAEYLAIYKASSLDRYRKDKHQKNDGEKIAIIESHISA